MSIQDVETFFKNNFENNTLPKMIDMETIQELTKSISTLGYYTWFCRVEPDINAEIFMGKSLRAEDRFLSKTFTAYERYGKLEDMESNFVSALVNLQNNFTQNYLEETFRCFFYPIADNFMATLYRCLYDNDLWKDETNKDVTSWKYFLESKRLTAHFRRILQFYVIPSQIFNTKPGSVKITMQKVNISKSCFIILGCYWPAQDF